MCTPGACYAWAPSFYPLSWVHTVSQMVSGRTGPSRFALCGCPDITLAAQTRLQRKGHGPERKAGPGTDSNPALASCGCALVTFLSQNNHTHSLSLTGLFLLELFRSQWLAGSKAGMASWKGLAQESCSCVSTRKHKGKRKTREDTPFQDTHPRPPFLTRPPPNTKFEGNILDLNYNGE